MELVYKTLDEQSLESVLFPRNTFFNIFNMPSSPPNETRSQPCTDAAASTSAQATTVLLSRPSRAYPKNIIVRSKHSHATLAKPRRRHREYPTQANWACDLPPVSSSHAQDKIDPSRSRKPTVSKRRNAADCPAHGKSCVRKNSCFLCLRSGAHQYAVVIDLAWPGRPIEPKWKKKKSKVSTMNTVEISFKSIDYMTEGTQAEVMQAIQDAVYQQSGRWKRWLWCYEIRTAEEVKVSILTV